MVDMETPFYEGRSRETDEKLRKVDCKISREEKSVKRKRGLLKAKLNEGSLVEEGKKVRQSSPLFFLYSFGVLRPRRPFIRELKKLLQ